MLSANVFYVLYLRSIFFVAQYDKMLYTDIVFVEQLWAKALDKARRKH